MKGSNIKKKIHGRAVPSVEAHHRVSGPKAGRNSWGRWIIIKNCGTKKIPRKSLSNLLLPSTLSCLGIFFSVLFFYVRFCCSIKLKVYRSNTVESFYNHFIIIFIIILRFTLPVNSKYLKCRNLFREKNQKELAR